MDSFVYCWVDAVTGMRYIGVHKGQPGDGYVCSSKLMKEEYKKRPRDFSRKVLFVGTFEEVHKFETWLLGCVDAANNPKYYNKTNNYGPFYNTGPHTENTKFKMSMAKKGKPKSPEHRAKLVAHLEKIPRGPSGPLTAEHRAKISLSLSGFVKSQEHKNKISAAKRGRPMSEEMRVKMRKPRKALTLEHRVKISATMCGRSFSPESRRKMSESRMTYLYTKKTPNLGVN